MGQNEIRALHDRWIIAPFDKVVHRLLDLSSLETPRNLHRRFNERLREVLRETRGVPASTVYPGNKGIRRVDLLRTCPFALKRSGAALYPPPGLQGQQNHRLA